MASHEAAADGVGSEGCLHSGADRPTDVHAASAASSSSAGTSASPADPQAKGAVERRLPRDERRARAALLPTSSYYQLERDAWFEKANARTHKTLRARPSDRLASHMRLKKIPTPRRDRFGDGGPRGRPRLEEGSPAPFRPDRSARRPRSPRPRGRGLRRSRASTSTGTL